MSHAPAITLLRQRAAELRREADILDCAAEMLATTTPPAPQASGPALHASPAETPAATALAGSAPPAPPVVGPFEAGTAASALPDAAAPSSGGARKGTLEALPGRAAAVLSALTDEPQRSRQILAATALLGVPRGSVSGALSALMGQGLATQDAYGRYLRATTATTATAPSPATTATPPPDTLRSRILAALADGPLHLTALVELLGVARKAVESAANNAVRSGVLERCAASTWRIVGAGPVPAYRPVGAGKRKSVTLPARRLSRRELAAGAELVDVDTRSDRPRYRADCVNGPRPCVWVSCAHNLSLDVDPDTGSIKVNFPGVIEGDFSAMTETCALDVADRDGSTLETVADALALTRERVRQVEEIALARVRGRGGLTADDAREEASP